MHFFNRSNTLRGFWIILAIVPVILSGQTVFGPGSVCVGDSITLTGSPTTSFTWSSSDIAIAEVYPNGIVEGKLPGSVIITYSDGVSTATHNVTVKQKLPTPTSVESLPLEFCPNDPSVSYIDISAASTVGYHEWFDVSGNIIPTSLVGPTPDVSSPGTTFYKVIENTFNTAYCPSDTLLITSIVYPNPVITVNSPSPVCEGESVTLIATGAGPSGFYAWDGGLSSGSTLPLTPTTTTTYSVTGTDENGCQGNASATITVNPLPSAPTTDPSNDTEYCLNDTPSELIATASAGHTLTWYDASNNILSTAASRTPSTTTVGTTLYKVTQTDGNGCESAPLNITVTVHALPTISVVGGASQTVCDGSSITLNGAGGVSYTWTGLDASGNPISNNTAFIPPVSATTTYTVTGTDANGCDNTADVDVTSNAAPVVTLSATLSTVCAGDDVVLTATGGSTYTWGPGVTAGATGATQTVSPTTSTTYTVTGTDANGCQGNASATITVNPLPSAPTTDPSNDTEYCLNDTPSELIATASAGHTLTWYDASNNILSTAASRTPSTTTVGTTLYKVTQTDGNGCESAPLNITVTVHALPTISVVGGASQTVCDGSSITLNGAGGVSYTWTGLDASGNPISNNTAFIPPVSATTTYTVTGTDANGCDNTADVDVVSNTSPSIGLSATPSTVCAGETVTLSATGGISYTWGPGVTAGATGATQTVSPTTSTTYTVTGTDASGCTGTKNVVVTANPLPVINASITSNYNGYGISCEGANDGAIQTNVNGGSAPYTYTWNNGASSPSISNLSEGTYIIQVEDSNGCISIESKTINEPSALSYSYVVDDLTCFGDNDGKIEIYPTGGVAPYSINWYDGTVLNYIENLSNDYYSFTITDANNCFTLDSIEVYGPTEIEINLDTIHPTCERINDGLIDAIVYGGTSSYSYMLNGSSVNLPLDSIAVGSYFLTVIDGNSCTQNVLFDLEPKQQSCFMIPNMFSPNYDGFNDQFSIQHSRWSSYTITIYNPIGQLVYSGSNNTPSWKGYNDINGSPLPSGDYYYQLITNEGEVFYGYVTLIR